MQLAAIIFDMDETLVASGPLWGAAERALLRVLGQEWSTELAAQYKGMNALDVAATIHRITAAQMPLAQCQAIVRETLIDGFLTAGAEPMPGAVQCVRRLRALAPLAVASGSPVVAIEAAMRKLGVRECMSAIVSSESVPRGKPWPDVFLATAEALGVRPERCLVFEDSLVGAKAAKAAGMKCFAVPSLAGQAEAIGREATRVFPSLAEVREGDVAAVFGR